MYSIHSISSCFGMTEPQVASSDATNSKYLPDCRFVSISITPIHPLIFYLYKLVECSIVRQGNNYIINGRKWWTTGAGDARCKVLLPISSTSYLRLYYIFRPMFTPSCLGFYSNSYAFLWGKQIPPIRPGINSNL